MILLACVLIFSGPVAVSLEDVVTWTVEDNERAHMAEADAAAAAARVDVARALFLPSLTAVGAYTRRPYQAVREIDGQQVVLQSHNALLASVGVSTNIFDARTIPLYRAALRGAEAAQLAAANEIRLLGFEAAHMFLILLGLEQVRDAAAHRLSYAQQSLHDAQARFSAQLVGANDVTRAELEAANAEAALTGASADVDSHYQQLGYLVAQPVIPPLQPPESLIAEATRTRLDENETARLPAEAIVRRLDVKARQRYESALRERAMEPPLRFVPALTGTAQARATNEAGFGHTIDGYAGVALTWSVFDGGLRTAEEAERDALAQRASLEAAALERRVGTDINVARIAVTKAQSTLREARAAADAAERNARESSSLYRQGLTSALALADANVRLYEAKVMLARQHFGVVLAYLDYRAALGFDALGREPQS